MSETYVSHTKPWSGMQSLSESQDIGIPQGTIIGPIPFLLFINGIPLHI